MTIQRNDKSAENDRYCALDQQPLLVTVKDARRLLSCGKTKLFKMIKAGELDRRKLGRATRVTLSSINKIAEGDG